MLPFHWEGHLGRHILAIAIGVVVSATAGTVILIAAIVSLAPEIDGNADLYALNQPPAYSFVDAKGVEIGHHGPVVGERLKLADMPPFLPAAFLAMEDRNFYDHGGIDPRGVVRAAVANYQSGATVQGGSTITQQLVKILFLTPERSFERKLREIGGAWELERKLSKEQILELYLNRIYLGSGAYGVDGAARVYFGKSAKDVNIAEAALLAALTRAPSVYTPHRDAALARQRAQMVLDVMVETGTVAPSVAEQAKKKPAVMVAEKPQSDRYYFFDAATEEVQRLVPGADGDLVIRTTFDPGLYAVARGAIQGVMATPRARRLRASQVSVVAMEPNGAVRALIGGRNYSISQFNRATQAKRQPGSAFKPFVYLAAMEKGMTPDSIRGGVTLNNALVHSRNSVALALQQSVGTRKVIGAAERMGFMSDLRAVPSLALGTSEVTNLELTGAYAGFASGGWKATPYFVVEARKPNGEIVYRHADTRTRIVDQEILLDMNAMMFDVIEVGTAEAARLADHEAAGKTGTSNDYRDAWFVGYTPQLVTGVWVGNDDFSPMKGVTGGMLPAEIWKRFMTTALKNKAYVPLPRSIPALVVEPKPVPPMAYEYKRDPYYSAGARPPPPDPYYNPYYGQRPYYGSGLNYDSRFRR